MCHSEVTIASQPITPFHLLRQKDRFILSLCVDLSLCCGTSCLFHTTLFSVSFLFLGYSFLLSLLRSLCPCLFRPVVFCLVSSLFLWLAFSVPSLLFVSFTFPLMCVICTMCRNGRIIYACFSLLLNSRNAGRIFVKFRMDIMPLGSTLKSYFSISRNG